tara:strand:+ start:1652 stop:3001 length:1350 start_codon:yes stop_codon:yes gene_type:complete
MIPLNVTLSYYKRKDIQEEMILAAKNREVAIRFNNHFGQRPDVLNNPTDILELAKQKATSFHISEELWKNPLQLNPNMKKHEAEELRIGWDLVLDIDCGFFEYSKIVTHRIIEILKAYGVKNLSCKFSGNKGFHIGVPFESFPSKIINKDISDLFPEAPKRIALFIKDKILKRVGEDILKHHNNNLEEISKIVGKKQSDLIKNKKDGEGKELDVESIIVIDTILISSRHLFRMPYSLHEKSGLVSIPINPEKVFEFKKEHADPKNLIVSQHRFLDKENAVKNDAKELIVQAFDFQPAIEETKLEEKKQLTTFESAAPEELFPPCIKLGLLGLKDGRKRFVFVLINFLVSAGWDYNAIEKILRGWNKKNPEPLREVTVLGQLRYHKQQKKKILPPNCSNKAYYPDIGICQPDNLCNKIKNPVSYIKRKTLFSKSIEKDTKKKEIKGKNLT